MKKSMIYPWAALLLAAVISFCGCSGIRIEEGFNLDIKVPTIYVKWFSSYLETQLWKEANLPSMNGTAGQDTTAVPGEEYYTRSKEISIDAIDEQREVIWEAWRRANILYEEEKLIPLCPLSEKHDSSWQIPSSLEKDAVMNYYFGSKGEVAPAEGWPLFLYMHGSGEPNAEWKAGYEICSSLDDAPSAYFIPQIPNEGEYYRWWHQSKQWAWEKLIRQAMVSGEFDPNRIYAFGISEGAYGSQRLASFYADYWAAAGPIAGGEPLINAPVENCKNIGFSLRTGEMDLAFCRETLTRNCKDEFDQWERRYPGCFKHFIELVPRMGHAINYSPTTPWLRQFVRNPYPKSVLWENMEMDGRYRDAFYNLKVLERSNPDASSRTYYEMDIQDNRINMTVSLVRYQVTERDPIWGIPLTFEKEYELAETGRFLVYLSPELVDLNQPVVLQVNGKEVYNGRVKPDLKHMMNSCATYFDPMRIYPAAIEVDLAHPQDV